MQLDSSLSDQRGYEAATVDLSGRCVGSSYILICPIGQGATGTVWRGVERTSGEQVAVKLLHESLLRQPKLVTRFVQERTILRMLRHENIVRVRDLFSAGETLGLVMDLVTGGSLREHLRREGTLPAGEAARLLGQVAAALTEAHSVGVVHRDVKPDNILLHSDGGRLHTRLTDFGIARVLDTAGLTTPHALIGTPRYLAPEAINGAPPGPAADVYALGVVLYELVAGRPPYDGDPVAIVLGRHLDDAPQRPADLPDAVWAVIAACLAKNPAERPPVAELSTMLQDLAREVGDLPALPALPAHQPPDELDDADGRPFGAAPAFPLPEHPSLPGAGRPVPRRRNRPPSWLWNRPWAIVALLAGALLITGVGGLSAWTLRELGAAGRPGTAATPVIAAAPTAPGGPAPVAGGPTATAMPAGPTTAGPSPAQTGSQSPAAIAVNGRLGTGPAAIRASAGPAAVSVSTGPGRAGAAARVFGPWQCGDEYRWEIGHPVLAKPCHAVGGAIRIVGHLNASPGVQTDVSLTVQNARTGEVVAGPHDCNGLMFTDFATQHTCGPVDFDIPRGDRYVVVQAWRYTGRSLLPGGTARGPEFSW